MLGKRCRTIQRTASISQNMGPLYMQNYNYHQAHHDLPAITAGRPNYVSVSHPDPSAVHPQVPAVIPQIIGFNPMVKIDAAGGGSEHNLPLKTVWPASVSNSDSPPPPNILPARPHPYDLYDDDPKYHGRGAAGAQLSTKRSQFTPRSALQNLLAAARQIACIEVQSSGKSTTEASKSILEGSSITSPSCAHNGTINVSATKQGSLIWQGRSIFSEATPKELHSDKHYITNPKASMLIPVAPAQATSYEYSQIVSMKEEPDQYQDIVQMGDLEYIENIFDVEGTSAGTGQINLESAQDHHALYLATSPLAADFTPNLGQSMSFLESCYRCKRPLGQGRDIFMYSVECRDKQMRLEERKEKLRSMHSQINKLNVRKQDIPCANASKGSGNITSYYQAHNHSHQHQQYSSQAAAAYNDQQHRTSLLMPAA
ncbi:hypothetical protein L7F22_017635 [Adiantum nelumboides]|nr:hypothetical protein [Adiantum nelumboides]